MISRDADPSATGRQVAEPAAASTSIGLLMLRWQQAGCRAAFTALVEAVRSEATQVAERVLQRRGVRDPDAVDDAVSLVLDHLRRLRDEGPDHRELTQFSPVRSGPRSRAAIDPGLGFVRQLAKARAIDVVRRRRRLGQRRRVFSDIGPEAAGSWEEVVAGDGGGEPIRPGLLDRLRRASRSLEPRERQLVEMLLEGKNQAVIAHVLEVSEGTVSRLRARTIRTLRQILNS